MTPFFFFSLIRHHRCCLLEYYYYSMAMLIIITPSNHQVQNRPFHSTLISTTQQQQNNNADWVCAHGFFKTSPSIPNMATCKACTNLSVHDCNAAQRFVPCSLESNAQCVACPELSSSSSVIIAYSPGFNDCSTVQCAEKYYYYYNNDDNSLNHTVSHENNSKNPNTTTSIFKINQTTSIAAMLSHCVACPVGSFCTNGSRWECAGLNLTTNVPGASSPLQCIPTTLAAAQPFEITMGFVFNQGTSLPGLCLDLYQVLTTWLEFGTILNCQIVMANYSTEATNNNNMGSIQCVVVSSSVYSSMYIQWLSNALETQRQFIQMFLSDCFQNSGLTITDLSAFPIAQSSIDGGSTSSTLASLEEEGGLLFLSNLYNNNNQSNGSYTLRLYPPDLVYEKPAWGQNPQDVVAALGVILMLFFSSCVSICMLLGGIILHYRSHTKKHKKSKANSHHYDTKRHDDHSSPHPPHVIKAIA